MLEQQKQNLSIALKNLSQREQLVLNLYYSEELTFKEIAKVLDLTEARISQNTCQSHIKA